MTSSTPIVAGIASLLVFSTVACSRPVHWRNQPTPPVHRGRGSHQRVGLAQKRPAPAEEAHTAAENSRPEGRAAPPTLAEVERAIQTFQRRRQTGGPPADTAWEPFLQTVFDYMDQPPRHLSLSPLIRARVAAEFELDTEQRRTAGADPELEQLVGDLLTHIDYRVKRIRTLAGGGQLAVDSGQSDRLAWPLAFGLITSEFGTRPNPFHPERDQFHQGIDLAAPPHEPVYAAEAGEVIFAGWNGGYGRMVRIRHPGGLETVYAHLAVTLVRWEQEVTRGQVVGLLGRSGRATGHHLHFGVYLDGQAVDPRKHLADIPMSFSDSTPGILFGYPAGS